MSRKQPAQKDSEPLVPYGADPSRRPGALIILTILYIAWFLFLTVLALRDSFQS